MLLGTAAFASLGLLLAGSLRAEATLAAANLVYLLLLAGGAVVHPRVGVRRLRRRRPAGSRPAPWARRMRDAPRQRAAFAWRDLAVLAGWAVDRRVLDREDVQVGVARWKCERSVRPLGWATLVANIGLVVTGGAVRLTGSGLGCPTWPRCTDESFRPHGALDLHEAIEFGNRMLTFVLTAIAVATFVAAWRTGRRDLRLPARWSSAWASPPRPSSAASPC